MYGLSDNKLEPYGLGYFLLMIIVTIRLFFVDIWSLYLSKHRSDLLTVSFHHTAVKEWNSA